MNGARELEGAGNCNTGRAHWRGHQLAEPAPRGHSEVAAFGSESHSQPARAARDPGAGMGVGRNVTPCVAELRRLGWGQGVGKEMGS